MATRLIMPTVTPLNYLKIDLAFIDNATSFSAQKLDAIILL